MAFKSRREEEEDGRQLVANRRGLETTLCSQVELREERTFICSVTLRFEKASAKRAQRERRGEMCFVVAGLSQQQQQQQQQQCVRLPQLQKRRRRRRRGPSLSKDADRKQ